MAKTDTMVAAVQGERPAGMARHMGFTQLLRLPGIVHCLAVTAVVGLFQVVETRAGRQALSRRG